jgi:DNA segregation ATPase FtsK/SpoIIIE-like protein
MGVRFRQGIRIFPGLRLNFTKSGVSTSVGGPGATINLSKRGIRGMVGVLGSGLSYSKALYKPGQRRNSDRDVVDQMSAHDIASTQESESSTEITEAERELRLLTMHLVVESGNASTSWLQRQLRIGYSEAAEVMALLKHEGIVSHPDRIGRREVLAHLADLPPILGDGAGHQA